MIIKNSTALQLWLGGAISAFIDGFLDGCPVGAPAGAGIAAADGQLPTTMAFDHHVLITVAHVLAVPFFSGLADIRAFKKDNSFPNIFAAPQPPSPTSTPTA